MKDTPERWLDLGEFIREQRSGARLSLRRLSDMAGISNPYLSQIERGLRRPSAEILQQIARALRISAETLYVRAGILEERSPDGQLVDAICLEPTLTEEQKATLIRIVSSFRRENTMSDAAGGSDRTWTSTPEGSSHTDSAPVGDGSVA
jgi:transcriptional regulator with XRE-family HTH domain